jgi:hypothetical protein
MNLCLVIPLLFNAFPSFLSLFVGLDFGGNGADLNLLKGRTKVSVERERITWVNLTSWWMFLQYLELRARQRLKMSLEFGIDDRRCRLDLLLKVVKCHHA